MTVVRMIEFVSGGRHDGRSWPPGGETIDVPDWEAKDLIAGKLAVPAGQGDDSPPASAPAVAAPQGEAPEPAAGAPPEPEPAPEPEPVPAEDGTGVSPLAQVSPLAETAGTGAGATAPPPEPAPEPAPSEPEQPEPPQPPQPHDIKAHWVAWAISKGEDPEVAPNMTKADLMSKYGGRL